jgi:hypothetical protein
MFPYNTLALYSHVSVSMAGFVLCTENSLEWLFR